MRVFLLLIPVCFLAACGTPGPARKTAGDAGDKSSRTLRASSGSLAAFQKSARRFKSVITVPEWESTPAEITRTVSNTILRANAALDAIASCSHEKVTFAYTITALDDISYDVSLSANRLAVIKDTSTNAALREAATDATKTLSEWAVGLDYREDVYRAVNAYAMLLLPLAGEEDKLLREVLRDYRRAGLELPKAARDEVE